MKNNILICGFGNIGIQIALDFLLNGNNIYIIEKKNINIDVVLKLFEEYLKIKKDFFENDLCIDLKKLIKKVLIIEKFQDIKKFKIDIVFECIDENLKQKILFYKKINSFLNKKTLIATVSTVFMPELFCKYLTHKANFCATHFHAPSYNIRNVDIRAHLYTDIKTIDKFDKMLKNNDFITEKIGIEKNVYIFNFMLDNLFLGALKLHINENYKINNIDDLWKKNTFSRKGPFELMDIIGLDTVLKITQNLSKLNEDENILDIITFLKNKNNKKELGVKTGKGFYPYPYFDNINYF